MPYESLERLRAFAERWKGLFEIVFTGILVFFTALLYLANKDYSRTARNAERPWLGIVSLTQGNSQAFGSNYTVVADQPIDLAVVYRNFGHSPALRYSAFHHVTTGEPPPLDSQHWNDTPIPDIDCRGEVVKTNFGPLFPSEDLTASEHEANDKRLSLSGPDKDAIVAGKKGLYVVGCFYYLDIDNRQRFTDFCICLQHDSGQATGTLSFCGKGNYTE